jgi:hypothetical protein
MSHGGALAGLSWSRHQTLWYWSLGRRQCNRSFSQAWQRVRRSFRHGKSWGRPNDKFGLGGAINGLSGPHRDFLAAGGLGLLIGDGALNYREEKILETFYAYNVNRWTMATFDYQFIANPAHNADRGPVSLFAARLHAEF